MNKLSSSESAGNVEELMIVNRINVKLILMVLTVYVREGANKSYGTRAFTGNPLILND